VNGGVVGGVVARGERLVKIVGSQLFAKSFALVACEGSVLRRALDSAKCSIGRLRLRRKLFGMTPSVESTCRRCVGPDQALISIK